MADLTDILTVAHKTDIQVRKMVNLIDVILIVAHKTDIHKKAYQSLLLTRQQKQFSVIFTR